MEARYVAEELCCLAERLNGPGVKGHEAEWLWYVQRHIRHLSAVLKAAELESAV